MSVILQNPVGYEQFLKACFQSKNQSLRKNLLRWYNQINDSVEFSSTPNQTIDLEMGLKKEGITNTRPWEIASEVYVRLFSYFSSEFV